MIIYVQTLIHTNAWVAPSHMLTTHRTLSGVPKGQRGVGTVGGVEMSRAGTEGRGRRGNRGASVQPTDKILQVIINTLSVILTMLVDKICTFYTAFCTPLR
jgi:hypothetical protein